MRTANHGIACVTLLLCCHTLAHADRPGRIEGQVARSDGDPIPGVGVAVDETSSFALTDTAGRFRLKGIPPGSYSLTFTLLDRSASRTEVAVRSRTTVIVDLVVDWEVAVLDSVTVLSASRRRERLVDAPAAVTTVPGERIERQAVHGQIPKLVEFTPGVNITQSGMYDFNLDTRGFNSALSRRVPVRIDGRDVTDPVIGAPEWATIASPFNDFASAELLRGPSGALYGINATSGVLSLYSKEPRYSQGGQVRLGAGGQDTTHLDFRWAGGLGHDWYAKVVGSWREEEDFAVSRFQSVEYSVECTMFFQTDCLPRDAVPFPEDKIETASGGVRFDKYLDGGGLLTLEGGTTNYSGTVFLNPGGTRGQILDTDWPWARVNFATDHWNVLAYYNRRDSESSNLTNGTPPDEISADSARLELQTNWSFAQNRVRLVAGASYGEESADAAVLRQSLDTDDQALFAQVDWQVSDRVALIAAARLDDASFHDLQFSPKGAVVWNVTPGHTLRFTYNEAFQAPTYIEYFLFLEAPFFSQDTSSLETICTNAGVSCGLGGSTLAFALGNEELELEQTTTHEIGYVGVLANKAYLTVDLYRSENQEFVTPFVPPVGTPLGTVNPNIMPWEPPTGFDVPPLVVNAVRAQAEIDFPFMQLTSFDGQNALAAFSIANFGQVDTEGIDLGLVYLPANHWSVSLGYSWFDYEIKQASPGLDTVLLPNSPENKAFVGVSYEADRWNSSLRGRWTDDFRWVNGAMQGDVESYTTVDLSGNYTLSSQWELGLYVANLFDNEHWEAFGGALIERRALVHVTFSW